MANLLRSELSRNLEDIPNKGVSLYGTQSWLRCTQESIPLDLQILKVYNGPQLCAYLPLHVIQKGGIIRAVNPVFTLYNGPWWPLAPHKYFDKEQRFRRDVLKELFKRLEKEFHHVYLACEDLDYRALSNKWRIHPWYTTVRKIKPDEIPNFAGTCTRQIKKAVKNGFSYAPGIHSDAYTSAYTFTYTSKKVSLPYPPQWLLDFRKALLQKNLCEEFHVEDSTGKQFAFATIIHDQNLDSSRLLYTCSIPESKGTGAMDLLYSESIHHCKKITQNFDLAGANHESLYRFKEKFANQNILKPAVEYYRNPFYKLLFFTYRKFSNLLKK